MTEVVGLERSAAPVRQLVDLELCERLERVVGVAMRRGLKPVRRPTVERSQLDAEVAAVRARFGPDLHFATTRPTGGAKGPGTTVELAYGHERERVEELARLTTLARGGEAPDGIDDIQHQIGAHLGYPACCVDAFLAASGLEEDLTELTLMRRRLLHARIDVRWPLLLIVYEHYLPCSLDCAESLLRADALEAALAEAGISPPEGGWESIKFFFHLEAPGNIAVLRETARHTDGFSYAAVALNHAEQRLDPLTGGDRLRFSGSAIEVLRGRERVHVFPAHAAVFAVDRFWGDATAFADYAARRVERARAAESAEQDSRASEPMPEPGSLREPEPPEPTPRPGPPSADAIATVVRELLPPGISMRACEAGRAGESDDEWIRVHLDGRAGAFEITIVPRRLEPERDVDAGAYACAIAARYDATGDVAAQRRTAATLADALDPRATAPGAALRSIHALVSEACHPASGEFRVLAGYAAAWPVCDSDGVVHVALVSRGRVLELLVAPVDQGTGWPARTRRCAIGYSGDRPPETGRERAAFARFTQLLRDLDDAIA